MRFGKFIATVALAAGAVFGTGSVLGTPGSAQAAGYGPTPPSQDWSFNGVFGTFDRTAAQRGFLVYKEVCSSCHAMRLLSYRNLQQIGFSPEEIRAIAAQYQVTDGPDDQGDMFQRPGVPADRFIAPFPNEQAARAANNNAYPVDLSLITKARDGGADYVFAFLTGYQDAPADVELMPGTYWNAYFPGHMVSMPNMLMDDMVSYADGTVASARQQAWDVVNFLYWAAEPNMEDRKRIGLRVMLFLLVFAGIMYAVKRRVWSDVH